MKTLKHNFFRTLSSSSKFDQKRYSTLPYCQTGLFTGCSLKEAADIFGCHVEFSCLWTGYSMKRAIDHKNSSREILEKFEIVLIRLTFLFLSFLTLFQSWNFSIIHGNKTS